MLIPIRKNQFSMLPTRVSRILLLALLGGSIGGCTSFGYTEHQRPRGVDGFPCAGEPLQLSAQQATPIYDRTLLQRAQGVSGRGGLCSANVWKLKKTMRVYRIWDQKDNDSQFGAWWLLERPTGLKDQYRFEYSSCAVPKALNHLISCEISVGSTVVVGTTQNNNCDDGPHPKTSMNQIYLPLASATGKHPVLLNCQDEGKWPVGRY